MGTNRSLLMRFDIAQWRVPVLILVVVGPLLGLGYIIALPFIGLVTFVLAISYRTARSLVNMSHRSTQATIDA